jgi:serine protease AprX
VALAVALAASFTCAGPVAAASASVAPSATGQSAHAGHAYGPGVSYVVRGHVHGLPALVAVLRARGIEVQRTIPLIDAVVVRLSALQAAALANDPAVAEVTADAKVQLQSNGYDAGTDANSAFNAAELVHAHDAWDNGYTGSGIDVALIDSGVTPVQGLAADGQVVNGPDLSFESQFAGAAHLDTFGHGTFMAGLIAAREPGTGADSSNTSAYQGIAPDARIVSVKVADALGRSDVSQVIAGIDWVVQHAHDPGLNIRVLNLSFGTDSTQSYVLDPLAYAAEVAWHSGIVVVVSAGNNGENRLVDPAIDPYLIAVGALDTNNTLSSTDDTIARFSNKGTSSRRVDVVAPGVHVQGLRVPGSFVDQAFGSSGRLGTRFFRGSGTSQATAIASGVAALVLSSRPDLTPDQVKRLLTGRVPRRAVSGFSVPDAARAIAAAYSVRASTQRFTRSDGTGSLEGSRGSRHVVRGTPLVGELDIFGNPVDTAALAAQEAQQAAWDGGTWNGATWAGASWAGASWAGASWDGASWDGASWDGASWDGASWDGASWDGASWDGASWDGASWDGASWDGASWDGASWDAVGWLAGSWS